MTAGVMGQCEGNEVNVNVRIATRVQDDFGECLAAPIQVTKEAVVKCPPEPAETAMRPVSSFEALSIRQELPGSCWRNLYL